ncbi:HD-GYP domain-containing protein [Calditrichota bacterium LG25]
MTHEDVFQEVHNQIPLNRKLTLIHENLQNYLPFIDRIAFALYDSKTDILRTFLVSEPHAHSLCLYESKLSEVPSLLALKHERSPRIIEDISRLYGDSREHSRRIKESGYRSSYTLPMFSEEALLGFIFFNSRQKSPFQSADLNLLDLYAHLIFSLILFELNQTRVLLSSLRTLSKIMHFKDPETGAHLERMAHFSRIIAAGLAATEKYSIDDEFIQFLSAFAPLHDIGKIGIPDEILFKPQKLEPREFQVMKQHTLKGREIIDLIISNLQVKPTAYVEMLRHIPELHHEKLNGRGYPHGYQKDQIPLEAQIIAVADIFDALTSDRPYKKKWTNEEALNYLKKHPSEWNAEIVQALEDNLPKIVEIQQKFKDEE